MGNLMKNMDTKDLDMISDSAIADSLDNLKTQDFGKAQCRKILEKVKKANGNKLGKKGRKMGKLMRKCGFFTEVDEMTTDDLDLEAENGTLDIDPSKAQAKILVKKIKAKLGDVTSANTKYTTGLIKKWGKIASRGLDKDDIKNLPSDSQLGSIMETIAEDEMMMDEAQ